MKLITATFLPLALMAYAGSSQPNDQSKQPQAQPPTVQAPAARVAPASASNDEAATQDDLKSCGMKWNKKLEDYKIRLEQTKEYRNYFEKWKNSTAQRPPMLPIPELTRASYRLCMAQCLGDKTATCPGGWPDEK